MRRSKVRGDEGFRGRDPKAGDVATDSELGSSRI